MKRTTCNWFYIIKKHCFFITLLTIIFNFNHCLIATIPEWPQLAEDSMMQQLEMQIRKLVNQGYSHEQIIKALEEQKQAFVDPYGLLVGCTVGGFFAVLLTVAGVFLVKHYCRSSENSCSADCEALWCCCCRKCGSKVYTSL